MDMLGLVYIILTFIVCFALVHVIKLAVVGFFSLKKKQPSEPEKKAEKKPEPVYYIVEKKRAKKTYSEPKEIQFKK
ncbi:MAG: hypothetical protein NC033_02765 [Clostridiales bacterium]|nr:hypothetical protein [Clostridiales bacterium]